MNVSTVEDQRTTADRVSDIEDQPRAADIVSVSDVDGSAQSQSVPDADPDAEQPLNVSAVEDQTTAANSITITAVDVFSDNFNNSEILTNCHNFSGVASYLCCSNGDADGSVRSDTFATLAVSFVDELLSSPSEFNADSIERDQPRAADNVSDVVCSAQSQSVLADRGEEQPENVSLVEDQPTAKKK